MCFNVGSTGQSAAKKTVTHAQPCLPHQGYVLGVSHATSSKELISIPFVDVKYVNARLLGS